MKFSKDNPQVIISILVLLVIVLSVLVIYAFVLKPAITGYVVGKQVEAQDIVINNMLLQLQQNGYVQVGVGNQSLILVPYQPPTEANNGIVIDEGQ